MSLFWQNAFFHIWTVQATLSYPGLAVPGLGLPEYLAGLKVGGIWLGSFGLIKGLFCKV